MKIEKIMKKNNPKKFIKFKNADVPTLNMINYLMY